MRFCIIGLSIIFIEASVSLIYILGVVRQEISRVLNPNRIYQFPGGVMTKYSKLDDLKQQKFILAQISRLEV